MKFYISLPDPKAARGAKSQLSFSAHGAETFAEQLRHALSDPAYIQSWLAGLDEDDAANVDPQLLAIDSNAKVSGAQHDLSFSLVADSCMKGAAFKHRMRLLAGSQWQLTDVK